MTSGAAPVQQRHLDLVEAIEARFDVARWRAGDVDLWPPARLDLYLDLFRAEGGETAPPRPPLLRRGAAGLATPLTNAWKSRCDLEHWRPRAGRADAVLLGDGVSLDRIDGAWRDRHGEPLMAALERQGRTTFLMQPGGLERLPWARPTFPANGVAVRAALSARLGPAPNLELPDHDAVLAFLEQKGVEAPSFSRSRLAARAATLAAAAREFQRILRRVKPHLAFAVTWYAGLGPAFALACRREGVLCVDLQHCPQDGAHRAYHWAGLPEHGYSTLPSLFWTWSAEDAARVEGWAGGSPWHRAIHGGHSQLASYLDDRNPDTRRGDERFAAVGGCFKREILVALQPIGGRREVWDALARAIEMGPADWRWWIRRHPSSTPSQDSEYRRLLDLKRPNVVVEQASALPLPALLRRMSVLVSLASGAAAEAALFGVPALFLDREALGTFPGLLARGRAEVVAVSDLVPRIAEMARQPARAAFDAPPPIEETLRRLDVMADDYRQLGRSGGSRDA